MKKGDLVLIPFPFTDLSGSKLRPALILHSDSLDVTVNFISTKMQWHDPNDLILKPNELNGLKKISLVRVGKITTIDKSLVLGKIGTIDDFEIIELNKKLLSFFKIEATDFQ